MAKRPTQDIKNKTSRSKKTKKRLAAKAATLAARRPRKGSVRSNRAKSHSLSK
ncbi:MAG TPA: hypothetical protein VFL98_02510 [Candidatus Paceibacterota bacterium]|nr:hypothetical protein [Candidatus Paceibacterota bacterium]